MVFHPSSARLEERTNSGRSAPILFPVLLVLVINALAVSASDTGITSVAFRISRLLFKGKSIYSLEMSATSQVLLLP